MVLRDKYSRDSKKNSIYHQAVYNQTNKDVLYIFMLNYLFT
jgi:hypothetical protein